MDNNTKDLIQKTLDRIRELQLARESVEVKENEVKTHENDLSAVETVKGKDSTDYLVKKELLENAQEDLKNAENKVAELSFKKSELKPVVDSLAKEFENELRIEQEREFHIEIGPRPDENDVDDEGNVRPLSREELNVGRKAFRTLIDYLYKDVNWTAKTAAGLMVLVRNMEENKPWVKSPEFDNIIMLRSSNVLVLWRSVLEEMSGKGYYEARAFLECWANCGKGLSEAVRDIQKMHENVRILGNNLNTIEDEYERSENDIEQSEVELTTQEEVAPEV